MENAISPEINDGAAYDFPRGGNQSEDGLGVATIDSSLTRAVQKLGFSKFLFQNYQLR